MRRRRQKKRGKKSTAAVWLVLFLLWGGNIWSEISWQESYVPFSSFWEMWREKQSEESSLEELLWHEQRLAMSAGMLAENRWNIGEASGDVHSTEANSEEINSAQMETLLESDGTETTVTAPEDMEEWQQLITERDADLLAEIDRENEAMRQQVSDLQTLALPYTEEQLESLTFLKENLYNVNRGTKVTDGLLDADTLLSMDMTLQQPDSGGPKVLIHHTHATEYFADSNEKDETTLIVGVGDYLEELLERRYGIEVIHDRTVYPYNEAYSQALKHVESILAANPTIEVFIDLHRDAGGTKKYTVNVEGKDMAHLMFFNGLSHSTNGPIEYLPNENLQSNLAFSFQMKMAGDSLYPGLCKRNYLKAYRYNLHVLPRAVIVEVGDNNNTLQEAKNAMEPLAKILHLILTGGV